MDDVIDSHAVPDLALNTSFVVIAVAISYAWMLGKDGDFWEQFAAMILWVVLLNSVFIIISLPVVVIKYRCGSFSSVVLLDGHTHVNHSMSIVQL